jgi:kynurenine formamidase
MHDRPLTRITFAGRPGLLAAGLGVLLVAGGLMAAALDETPIGSKWWPSRYGPDDQRGAANLQTPEKVLQAVKLIKTGRVYQLGHLYENGMPVPGNRHFSLTIPGSPTSPPAGKNRIVSHDEMVSGEIGQVGTQFDGLGHVGTRLADDDYFYNGFKRSEFGTAYGLTKLGVENVGVFFTRGILLDVARLKGAERLPTGYVITVEDVTNCLKADGLTISPGDIVLIRTGHSQLWMKDNAQYGKGEPGIGMEAAGFLAGQQVSLIGADTWAIEVVPPQDPERPFQVHQFDITRNGIYHLENLDLEQLAADKIHEFAFVFSPLRLKGATGSPGNPIAIR